MADAPAATVRRRASLRARLALALGAALATFALLEGALWALHPLPLLPPRLAHRFLPAYYAMGPAPRALEFDPGPLPGVTPGLHTLQLNRWGYFYAEAKRTRRAPDELRIAAIGGSTVECSALRADKQWTAVLEDLLRAEQPQRDVTVLNLGLSATDTRTHLATLAQHAIELDLDLVVLMLGANDLSRAEQGEFPLLSSDNFYPPASVWRDLRDAWHRTQIGRHIDAWHERQERQPRTTPYFQKEIERQAALPELQQPLRLDESALAGYARNIVSLAGLCREHGIAVLFTTQPTMLTATPSEAERALLWGMNNGRARLTPGNFVDLLTALNRRLLDTCAAHDYACVDLAALLPKGLGCFYDQVHFNEAGARAVAAALAPRVREVVARRSPRR